MPSAKARRIVLPPLTDGQQVLFSFADEFPKDQRKPEAERVLAARRREKKTSVVVPVGMHVHIRERADLVWHPVEPVRRGRPPKPQSGTWEDDEKLLTEVQKIVGNRRDRKDYADDAGADVYQALEHLTERVLGRRLTSDEDRMLRHLFSGTDFCAKPRRARGRRRAHDDDPVPPEKASVIVRQLLVWRHDVTDPDVRRMQRSLREGRPRVKMIFR